MKRGYLYCVWLVCILGCMTSSSYALDDAATRPAKIKAAIVYKIARFVSWPSIKGSFTICASENDPLVPPLREIVKGKELQEKPISIVTFDPAKYLSQQEVSCQILLIEDATLETLNERQLPPQSGGTLTICMAQKPGRELCTAQIFEEGNRARISIDPSKAEKNGLKVSSELLDLAARQ